MKQHRQSHPFVFSHPDYTVGCGISPHQLALADLFG